MNVRDPQPPLLPALVLLSPLFWFMELLQNQLLLGFVEWAGEWTAGWLGHALHRDMQVWSGTVLAYVGRVGGRAVPRYMRGHGGGRLR